MHPTELTDLLNGWGPGGPGDAAGWEAMLPEWSALMEWLLANRQNRVQWVLLDDPAWGDFSEGAVRQQRLKRLVDILGPVLILGLGLLIAGIIMSVLAAILSVNELAF